MPGPPRHLPFVAPVPVCYSSPINSSKPTGLGKAGGVEDSLAKLGRSGSRATACHRTCGWSSDTGSPYDGRATGKPRPEGEASPGRGLHRTNSRLPVNTRSWACQWRQASASRKDVGMMGFFDHSPSSACSSSSLCTLTLSSIPLNTTTDHHVPLPPFLTTADHHIPLPPLLTLLTPILSFPLEPAPAQPSL